MQTSITCAEEDRHASTLTIYLAIGLTRKPTHNFPLTNIRPPSTFSPHLSIVPVAVFLTPSAQLTHPSPLFHPALTPIPASAALDPPLCPGSHPHILFPSAFLSLSPSHPRHTLSPPLSWHSQAKRAKQRRRAGRGTLVTGWVAEAEDACPPRQQKGGTAERDQEGKRRGRWT